MRFLRTAVALGAVTALLVAPVSAAPATTGDAVGGVAIRLSANRVHYTVSAKETPNGPNGSFLFRGIDFRLTFGGPVTCFDIEGNLAAIGGVITHTAGPDSGGLLGLAYLVFIEDNGVSGDLVSQTYILPGDDEDFIVGGVPGDFPDTCPAADAERTDGAFEVHGPISDHPWSL